MNRAMKVSSMKKESSDKISVLLRDTVLLLCRNGFNYNLDVKVQGLIAITLDNKEIFLVQFDETLDNRDLVSCDTGKDKKEPVVGPTFIHNLSASQRLNPLDGMQATRQRPSGRRRKRGSSGAATILRPSNDHCEVVKVEDSPIVIDHPGSKEEDDEQELDFLSAQNNQDEGKEPGSIIDQSESPRPSYRPQCAYDGSIGRAPPPSDASQSQGGVKEEESSTNVIDFSFAMFQEADCMDNLNLSSHVPMFGTVGGEVASGSQSFSAGQNNTNHIWSSFGNFSGRGRRARRSGQKTYCCEHPGCGLSFYRSYTLYRHQRLKHGRRLVPSVSHKSRDLVHLTCPASGCGQVFTQVAMLDRHNREMHRLGSPQQLISSENLSNKNLLDRYDDNDLLFEGVDYGLLARQNVT